MILNLTSKETVNGVPNLSKSLLEMESKLKELYLEELKLSNHWRAFPARKEVAFPKFEDSLSFPPETRTSKSLLDDCGQ